MGLVKRRMMEEYARGWSPIGDLYVCADCFEDQYIQSLVNKNAKRDSCSYCGRQSEDGHLIAAPVDLVLKAVARTVYREWVDPAAELPVEGGEFVGVTSHILEILDQYDLGMEIEELTEDFAGAFHTPDLCQRNYYSLPPYERLRFGWRTFKDIVVHRRRYLFAMPLGEEEDSSPWRDPDEILPLQMLEEIATIVRNLGLDRELPTGTRFARVRIHRPSEIVATAAELGPPPTDKAIFSNRMSPAGIVMFYGAESVETALLETDNGDRKHERDVTSGVFETTSALCVLDLCKLPPRPSAFDPDKEGSTRHGVWFLDDFVQDATRPVAKNRIEDIEYVPTQVVAEYFRDRYLTEDGKALSGILYPSARHEGGTCCALFCHSVDIEGGDGVEVPAGGRRSPILRLVPNTVRTSRLPKRGP